MTTMSLSLPAPGHATHEAADLAAIVALGSGIREVARLARQVNVTAVNAMLVSRRANGRAVGFAVAASELRGFAAALVTAMEALGHTVSRMVRDVALGRRLARHRQQYARVAGADGTALPGLEAVARRQAGVSTQVVQGLVDDRRELARLAGQALRQCGLGLALARSAAIEAAHAGEFTPMLRQVADQLAAAVTHIADILKGLRGHLEETRP